MDSTQRSGKGELNYSRWCELYLKWGHYKAALLLMWISDVNTALSASSPQITRENYGLTEVKELVPGGESVSVDKNNRWDGYMHDGAAHSLNSNVPSLFIWNYLFFLVYFWCSTFCSFSNRLWGFYKVYFSLALRLSWAQTADIIAPAEGCEGCGMCWKHKNREFV